MNTPILEIKGVSKSFPGVKALDDINIKIRNGEVHSLCGENGAGKSTLIKILSGVYSYGEYEGEILINGKKMRFQNINDAEEHGIVCIHQELALVPELSIQENIFLGNEPNNIGIIKEEDVYRKTLEILKELDLTLDPTEKVGNLGIGQQQLVEIAKALSKNTKVLILDEPTSALTEQESEILLGIVNKLKDRGVTSIYISHKLDEVMNVSDSVSAIRDGQYIGTRKIEEVTKDDIIYMMVGRKLEQLYPRKERKKGDKVLEIKKLSVFDPDDHNRKIIKDISFSAYKGEILGIAGLMGAGRTEMVSSIFGVYPGRKEGKVLINDEVVNIKNANDAIKNGIALVSEDRQYSGLVLEMSVKQNISLANLKEISNLIINETEESQIAMEYIDELNIRTPGMETIVNNLSGGNQQKVVLSKWLFTKPDILILDEPTRGIDIGAKFEIYEIMNKLVDAGVIVIMISSELEEVLGMSDRVLVIAEGELKADLKIKEATQEKILSYATGGA